MTKGVSLSNLSHHTLAPRFYDLMLEIEKLPGGPRQTALVIALGKLRDEAELYVNTLPHKWWVYHGMTCCEVCGIVRNDQNGDKPCKGPVVVEPRSATEGGYDWL